MIVAPRTNNLALAAILAVLASPSLVVAVQAPDTHGRFESFA